jgi:hypothetical protein
MGMKHCALEIIQELAKVYPAAAASLLKEFQKGPDARIARGNVYFET